METVLTQSRLAKRLGMPRATVAAALNPKTAAKLRPELREHVREAADRMGYVPHQGARSLRLGKTHTIALVTSQDLRHPYVIESIEQIRLELGRHGYRLNLDLAYQPADQKAVVAALAPGGCDGVVRFGFEPWARAGMLALRHRGLSVVGLQSWPEPDFDTIGSDRREEGRIATHHLLEQGHRTIACVVGPMETGERSRRVDGYQAALQAAGAGPTAPLLFHFPVEGDVKQLWEQIKSARPQPTAMFVYNDELALRLMHTVRLDGGRVPEDMAVVSVGNTWVGHLSEVPMTSVDQNRAEVARVMVARLLERIAHPQMPPRHILVKPFLVERESSRKREPERNEHKGRFDTSSPPGKGDT